MLRFQQNQKQETLARSYKIKKLSSENNLLSPVSTLSDLESHSNLKESQSQITGLTKNKQSKVYIKLEDSRYDNQQTIEVNELTSFLQARLHSSLKLLHSSLTQTERKEILSKLASVTDAKGWHNILEKYLQCQALVNTFESEIKKQKSNRIIYTTNSVQKRQIIVSVGKPGKGPVKPNTLIQSLEKENTKLKGQLGKSKVTISELQKKMLKLISDYKQRKQIYLKEIEKLTKIINTSIKDIPEFLLKSVPEAKEVEEETDKQITFKTFLGVNNEKYNEISTQNVNPLLFSSISRIAHKNKEDPQDQQYIIKRSCPNNILHFKSI